MGDSPKFSPNLNFCHISLNISQKHPFHSWLIRKNFISLKFPLLRYHLFLIIPGKPAVNTGIIRGKLLPFTSFPSLASSGGLSTKEPNLASTLKNEGYSTAFYGYWKLGLGPKGNEFFDFNRTFTIVEDVFFNVENLRLYDMIVLLIPSENVVSATLS